MRACVSACVSGCARARAGARVSVSVRERERVGGGGRGRCLLPTIGIAVRKRMTSREEKLFLLKCQVGPRAAGLS